MTPRQPFHPEALEEYLAAIRWHEEQRPGAGSAFALAVTRSLDRGVLLTIPPQHAGGLDPRYRRLLLHRFRYALIVELRPDADPFVIALAHHSREPGYWLFRVKPRSRRRKR